MSEVRRFRDKPAEDWHRKSSQEGTEKTISRREYRHVAGRCEPYMTRNTNEARMSDLVQSTKSGDVAVVTINNPPVNALSPGVIESLARALEEAERDDSVHAIVIMGAGRTFIAGADIKEFGKIVSGQKPSGEGLHPLLARVENCRKPVVMAIHGQAFGGGLEL